MRVKLGHVRTDDQGRLIVFPADGMSDSAMRQNPIDNFADNDGWYDDWADGWVKADVTIDGKAIPVESAWVACCGPNYAPEIQPFMTMYDVVRDVMVNGKKPALTCFRGTRCLTRIFIVITTTISLQLSDF